VTVTDNKPAEALADNLAALAGLPIAMALGGHPLELLDAVDIVFVSPGVPLEIPFLAGGTEARGVAEQRDAAFYTAVPGAGGRHHRVERKDETTTTLVGEINESQRPADVGWWEISAGR